MFNFTISRKPANRATFTSANQMASYEGSPLMGNAFLMAYDFMTSLVSLMTIAYDMLMAYDRLVGTGLKTRTRSSPLHYKGQLLSLARHGCFRLQLSSGENSLSKACSLASYCRYAGTATFSLAAAVLILRAQNRKFINFENIKMNGFCK